MCENKENIVHNCVNTKNANFVFREKNIHISVDLVDAARKQLVFLREVDKHPDLYSGELVRQAIRRYEQLWLPLVAEHNGKEIAPPLDVHWVWHVHMLAPYYYEKDCLSLVNCVPDHKLLSDNSRHTAMQRAKAIWEDSVPGRALPRPAGLRPLSRRRQWRRRGIQPRTRAAPSPAAPSPAAPCVTGTTTPTTAGASTT